MKWKLLGLAGLVGAVAVGATTVNRHRRRAWTDYEPTDLRERLHARLRSATSDDAASQMSRADVTAVDANGNATTT